jgi:hypothetical protein
MRWRRVERELNKYLSAHARQLHTPAEAVRAMLDFYRDIRAEDCALERDGDMLLFQWGSYDWGSGRHFEFDITRQLIAGRSEDEDIWQLHLTFEFAPSEELTALGAGNRWCRRPDDVPAFESFVLASPSYAALAGRTDGRLHRSFECAG